MSIQQPRTVGLTLGKFAPFHRGHQLVFDTALAEVDHLIAIIYDSAEVTAVPLPVRAAWLRDLYPQAHVVEAWDGPKEVGNTLEIRKVNEEYVIERLGIRGVTHFYSSEFYGDHMSHALGAVNRMVDAARTQVPASGTQIRADPYTWRHLLHPRVYRDLITNVVFLGAPSTGKTTLTEHLASVYETVWMPEYGRDYWAQHQIERRLEPAQLVEIADGHLAREEQLLCAANRYLFTDTNALTTRMFALEYHGAADARLNALADAAASRYDLVFVCDIDIPYDDTWDRSGDVSRQTFQKKIIADLLARNVPFITLRGSLQQRAATVAQVLARFTKYTSVADRLFHEPAAPALNESL